MVPDQSFAGSPPADGMISMVVSSSEGEVAEYRIRLPSGKNDGPPTTRSECVELHRSVGAGLLEP